MTESSIHAALKSMYSSSTDQLEQLVNQYYIDVVTENELIEIQTGNFSNIKRKLTDLLPHYSIRIVHPIPVERWILRINQENQVISRRKSPKKRNILDIFNELIYILPFLDYTNFTFEVILIKDEIIYIDDGRGSWRRKGWSIFDRKLIETLSTYEFKQSSDFKKLLPVSLPENFTTRQLAMIGGITERLSRRIAYSLYNLGQLNRIGKEGNAWVYQLNNNK